jgi:hypothetical protein
VVWFGLAVQKQVQNVNATLKACNLGQRVALVPLASVNGMLTVALEHVLASVGFNVEEVTGQGVRVHFVQLVRG